MIRGTVNSRRQPIIRIRIIGPDGAAAEIDAIVDSGFTGTLTLPASVVTSLKLTQSNGGRARLADGTERIFDTFDAAINWHGTLRNVLVSTLGPQTLIGMKLLDGNLLQIEAKAGGAVEIIPLQS